MPRVQETEVVAARHALRKALPEHHPARGKVENVLHRMFLELGNHDVARTGLQTAEQEAARIIDAHYDLVEVVQDYSRGIRDWDEVRVALEDAIDARDKRTETKQ